MHSACQTVNLLQCDNHQSCTEVAMEVRARQKSHRVKPKNIIC